MQHSHDRVSFDALLLATVILVPLLLTSCKQPAGSPMGTTVTLQEGWQIREAAETEASGAELSRPGYDSSSWISAEVPTTVLAAQVRAGIITDPYFGRKLEQIPVEPYTVRIH